MDKNFEKMIRELLEGAPDYTENKDFWEFLHDAYKGGKSYLKEDYLAKHKRETNGDYKTRKANAAYTNVVSPVVDLYTSYVYTSPIVRKFDVPPTYDNVMESINENIDLNSSSTQEFMAKVARWTMVYGRMLVIIDSPNFEGTISLSEAVAQGLLPYATMYPPTSIINYRLSIPGMGPRHLKMLLLKEGDDDVSGVEYYKLWTLDTWYLLSVGKTKIDIIDFGDNNLGYIPAVSSTYKDGFSTDLDDGESLISDISYLARKIFNLDSNVSEIIASSAFPILEIPYRAGDDEEIEIGVGNALPYDINHPEARASWLEPPQTSISAILAFRDKIFSDIQYVSHTLGASVDKTSESGVALEARMMSLHSTLGAMSVKLQKVEEKIFNTMYDYLGIKADISISYPSSFSVRDLSTDLDNAIKAKNLIGSKTFANKLDTNLADKVITKIASDSEVSKDDKNVIQSEIEVSNGSRETANNNVSNMIDTINNG